jgi:hypothetical protein
MNFTKEETNVVQVAIDHFIEHQKGLFDSDCRRYIMLGYLTELELDEILPAIRDSSARLITAKKVKQMLDPTELEF